MRRKSERQIPDFSPKRKGMTAPHGVEPVAKLSKASQQVRPPLVKPHGTSAKGGRRGA
jgi:hypothetical protein